MLTKEKHFRHLSFVMRLQLEAYLKADLSIKSIAEKLGVHISTVYREVKRGRYNHLCSDTWIEENRYSPDIAENKYRANLLGKGAGLKIGKDFALAKYIEKRIADDKYSPSAVLGEIKHKGLLFKTSICVATLYSYISKGVFYRLTVNDLPDKGKRKKHNRKVKASRVPRGLSIEKRSAEISSRTTFGHWEMDCVCGPTLPTLLVLTERLSRKEIIMPMKDQKALSVIKCLNSIEHKFGKSFRKVFKSITVDNGSEFSYTHDMESSIYGGKRTTFYYCHPYSSYERGTNERFNREIRRKIPKGTNLASISPDEVLAVQDWLNNYPRRILNWSSAEECFTQQLNSID